MAWERGWTSYESGTIIGRFNTLRAFLRAIVSASAELSCMLRNPGNPFLTDKKHAQHVVTAAAIAHQINGLNVDAAAGQRDTITD